MSHAQFVLWSREHRAWRRALQMGFTETLADAGTYTLAEAQPIVRTYGETMIPVAALASGGRFDPTASEPVKGTDPRD